MWKKGDAMPEPESTTPEPMARRDAPRAQGGAPQRATIGRSISIKGEVTGDEDLLIQGTIDGSVDLKQHSITVGPEGEVNADITGRVVTVEGTVEGNLTGHEQVILKSTAKVKGDIKAPRVILEDGASFRGGVDMGESSRGGKAPERAPEVRRTPPALSPSPSGSAGSDRESTPRTEKATP